MSAISRLYPLTGSIFERLRKARGTLGDLPSELVAEAETLEQAPAYMDPADWDRVRGVEQSTTLDNERLRIAGGLRRHGATTRYRLGDALATPRGVFSPLRSLQRHGPAPLKAVLTEPMLHVDKAFFPMTSVAMAYFGHLINDSLPASLLTRSGETLCLPYNPSWHHARGYCEMLGLSPAPAPLVYAREMWLTDDRGMNTHRHARTQALHGRLHSRLAPSGHAGVFLRRGETGASRGLQNENEVAEALAARGYAVCDVASPLPQLLAALAQVPVVVTVEGSQWVHGHFGAALGALMVVINPADRFNALIADMVPALGQRMATIVADKAESGYHVDVQRLLALIDRAQDDMARTGEIFEGRT